MHHRAVAADTGDLFHRAHRVGQVLYDILGVSFTKSIRCQRPRQTRQIMDDVRVDMIADIEVDRTGDFLPAAAEVEHVRHGDVVRFPQAPRTPE